MTTTLKQPGVNLNNGIIPVQGKEYRSLNEVKAGALEAVSAYREVCNEGLQGADLSQSLIEGLPNAWEFLRAWQCACVHKAPRLWQLANGVKRVALQCVACGSKFSNGIKNSDYPGYLNLPPFDELLPEQARASFGDAHSQMNEYLWYTRQQFQDRCQQLDELARLSQNQEWWIRYSKYLLSPEWQEKRQRVLERDSFTCQACLKRAAVQVHHLTYENVFNEPLFQLTSVCNTCHRALHPHMEAAL